MRVRRGYTMLIALILVAAATLFMGSMMDLGGGERLSEGSVRNQDQALAIAEVGMERTYAYLTALVRIDGDFDRALDPNLDDHCNSLPLTTNTGEDHLPPFPDGMVVDGGAGQLYVEVSSGGGAYLVRIDDDDDDQTGIGYAWAMGNNVGAYGCSEGAGIENLVRDTNQTVIVTVIGLYPGTSTTEPQSQQVLRVVVSGHAEMSTPGLIAGGAVSLLGSASVGGYYDNISALGDVNIHSVAYGATIRTTGSCSAGGIPTPFCEAGDVVPPVPATDPWDVTNAPFAWGAMPFYYARYDLTDNTARLWNWNYPTCPSPRAYARICYPNPQNGLNDTIIQLDGGTQLCAACWNLLYSGPTDGGAGHDQIEMSSGTPPVLFQAAGAPNQSCSTEPDAGASPMWPGTVWPGTIFTATYPSLPGGVWFLEGNLRVNGPFGSLQSVSLDVLGDIQIGGGGSTQISFYPAAPKGYVLLAGRDLLLSGGGEGIGPTPMPAPGAVVMVHEQLGLGNGNAINTQVAVGNRSSCDSLVPNAAGVAINATGTMQLNNNQVPPLPDGPPLTETSWTVSLH